MDTKSRASPNHHQYGPSLGCILRHYPMPCHSSEFPLTGLYDATMEPISRPITVMHAHDSLEMGYCHDGSGVLVVEDRVLPFAAGDICAVAEGKMHMARSAMDRPSRWSHFWADPGLLLASMPEALGAYNLGAFAAPTFPCIISHRRHEELCLTVRRIVNEIRDQVPGYRLVAKGLAFAMVGMLLRVAPTASAADAVPPDRKRLIRIAPALHHLANHYAETIDVTKLAALCHLSKTHFNRVFHAAIGTSSLKYLAQLRSRMAAAILTETDKPICGVAYEVGFESINTFNRQFLATMRLTPKQWRQRFGRQADSPVLGDMQSGKTKAHRSIPGGP